LTVPVVIKILLSVICGITFLLSACADGEAEPRITVAAAADLQYAFAELERPFEERCECELVLTFGSSGRFATQIQEGLPVDVFASADVAYVEDLDAGGFVLSDSIEVYAIGLIVLAVPAGSDLDPVGLDVALDDSVRRFSIANPDHAPYGVAAMEALQSAGLWEAVQRKLVLGENAAQATRFVETGDAQAGIVPLSLAIQREDHLRYALIDDALHSPILQAAAVVSTSGHPDLARSFIEFVNSAEGSAVMAEYGFLAPDEAAAP
jgi:molybdate transport system substrate-binding protein